MTKTLRDRIVDFCFDYLPGLVLPKPADLVAKHIGSMIYDKTADFHGNARLRKELKQAAWGAESDFRKLAIERLPNSDLVQAIVSFPVFDNELFQESLSKLPDHLDEEFLAKDLEYVISKDWDGKFTPTELREGVALYLNCLRLRLLKVSSHANVIQKLANLRVDQRTENMERVLSGVDSGIETLLKRSNPIETDPARYEQEYVTTRFTIPPPVIDFTGREIEVSTLVSEVSHDARVVAISGGGGMGKTELARKVADIVRENFPIAQLSIDLMGVSETPLTSDEAMRRILQPFFPNQVLPEDGEQLRGLYQDTLTRNKSLLLLDNASNTGQIRFLIPTATSTCIITSRQRFSLSEFGLPEPLQLNAFSIFSTGSIV